ncbi:MAG: FtsX-like permease family protein [Pseudomonadota bacterium]|nr:FtsX-like permease family protein [Pseudomonadota bacterium]
MTRTRWHKIVRDLAYRPARTLLTLFGLTLGLVLVGSTVTALAIMRNDLDANFRLTNPANITLSAGSIPMALRRRIAALPGVTGVEERPEFGALIETRPGRWMPLLIAVVGDFQHAHIARIAIQDRRGPPVAGSLSIERDGRWFFDAPPPVSLMIRLPDGRTVGSAFSGYVFDAARHPSRMEQVVYGYITPETFAAWSLPLENTRLLVTTSPAAAVAAGAQIEALFRQAGSKLARLEVHPIPEHGHRFQFDTIRALLAGMAVVALIMCALLIVNLVDSLMASEQRVIGVLRALGARSGQIIHDYLLGTGALGMLAGILSLYPSLWAGRMIARYLALGLNFDLLSPGPLWLCPSLMGIAIGIPVSVALSAISRAAHKPVRQSLARGDAGQAIPFADGVGALLGFLPLIPRSGVRSVMRKPRKVLLNALIVSLGLSFFVTALTVRASLLSTVASVARTQRFDLGIGLRAAVPIDRLKAWMKETPGVRHADYWSTAEATLHRAGPHLNNPRPVLGIPRDDEAFRPDLIAGHWIAASIPTGIVINQTLLRDEPDLHLGSGYTMTVDGHSVDVTVVGIIREFNPGRIYCPKSLLDGLLNQAGRANAMVLRLDDGSFEAQRQAARKIESSAIGPDRQISGTVLTRTLERVILGHLNILTGLSMLIGVMMLAVGAMGLASTLSVGVVERFREIAILKAIGGRSSTIAALFATEAVVIALIGWTISACSTPLLSRPVVAALGSAVLGYGFEYRTNPIGLAIALGVAVLVALLATLLPVRAATASTVRQWIA